MSPEISIVVPVYNAGEYLRECLDSLSAQTFDDIEVLLIDDGSTDGSGAICDEYAAKDPRFRVRHQPNAGPAMARNAALDMARGEYLAFCDSDDMYRPEYCERMLALIRERDCDAVMCGSEVFSDTGLRADRYGVGGRLNPAKSGFVSYGDGDGPLGLNVLLWNKMFKWRKVVANGIGFPRVYSHEDDAFCYQYALCSERYYCTDEQLYRHRLRSGSLMDLCVCGTPKNREDRLSVLDFVVDFACRNRMETKYRRELLRFAWDTYMLTADYYSADERTGLMQRIVARVGFLFTPSCYLEPDGEKLWKELDPVGVHDVAALLEYAVKFALTGSGSPKKDRWRVSMRHYAGRCRRLFCR